MTISASAGHVAEKPSARVRCLIESVVLALGLPAAIWVVSKLLSLSFTEAAHGSEQRFLLWISGPAVVEWSFVVLLWFV
jgi:hypothetical protein